MLISEESLPKELWDNVNKGQGANVCLRSTLLLNGNIAWLNNRSGGLQNDKWQEQDYGLLQ